MPKKHKTISDNHDRINKLNKIKQDNQLYVTSNTSKHLVSYFCVDTTVPQ